MDNGGEEQKLEKKTTWMEREGSIDIRVAAEVEKIWITYDLDKNGVLDFDEVKVYLKKVCPHMPEDQLIHVYNKIDLNKNGTIDKEEMAVFVKALFKKHHFKTYED